MTINSTFIDEQTLIETSEYQAAIREELKALDKNQTWELVCHSEGVKVMSTRWVLSEKGDNDKRFFKAHLVAWGLERVMEMQ